MSNFKVICILFSFLATNAFAYDRAEDEDALLVLLDIEFLTNSNIDVFRSEAIRMYPSLTEKNIDEIFLNEFKLARKLTFQAYKQSFSVFNDKELKDLVNFYNTEFGKWYIKNFKIFNQSVVSKLVESTQEINDAYLNKIYELESP